MTPQDLLSTLVNVDRVRSSIRRLFTGEVSEILGELLQTSQRARANTVTITTNETGCIYEDNGHGLLGGVAGFHTLLKIAQSNFDNPTLESQDPMGLGIHALLAHGQVSAVRFESGELCLAIDTARWWTDQAYYSTWFERLETLAQPVSGMRVIVACKVELRTSLQSSLMGRTMSDSPARGYDDLLRVTLDGITLDTALPAWATIGVVLVETNYQGCPLTLRYTGEDGGRSAVNWYGQVIADRLNGSFAYTLHVRAERPINPMSPSRRGLMNDEAYSALIAFLKAQLFAFLFALDNRARIRAEWVSAYYRFDHERAIRDAPYFIAAPLVRSEIGSVEDLNRYDDPRIFAYSEAAPTLLEETVMALTSSFERGDDGQLVQGAPKFTSFEYGRDSFLPMVGEGYTLLDGNIERLEIGTLWWKPGSARDDELHLPGAWGIRLSNGEPASWKPVTISTVFALNDPSCWDVDAVDFVVGTSNPLTFYQNEAWAGFDPQNDDDYDQIRDSYEETCAAHIRKLIGDAIPAKFDLCDIMRTMQEPTARITSIRYHYLPGTKTMQNTSPIAITVRNSAGERKRLKLVA
jgi:hypothetical protein